MQFNRDASGAHDAAAQALDRHRHGARADRRGAPGQDVGLRHRPVRARSSRTSRASSGKTYRAREEDDVSMQVIADHARAATFLIADGVTPSNEWRGYVLRRIMRRAMRHGRMLGLDEPFLWDVTGGVVELMGDAYPEIREAQARVAETVRQEEERFAETLDLGMAQDPASTWRRASADAAPSRRRQVPVHALRHLRVPARSGPGGVPGRRLARCRRRADRVFEAEMEAQRERARAGGHLRRRRTSGEPSVAIYQRLSAELRQARSSWATPRSPRPRGSWPWWRTAGAGREARAGRDGGGHPRPHARLRGVRRPDGRHRRGDRPRGSGARSRTPTTAAASSSCTGSR